jgi:2-haloacid dehalogenase
MKPTLAFDVYGTLIDPIGIALALQDHVPEAPRFAQLWRDKQLEYSFRRGLMGKYEDFSVCTRQALEYTCQLLGVKMPAAAKQELMDKYRILPAFPDVRAGLERLRAVECRMFAFSNGLPDDIENLLVHAGVRNYLDGVISVHEVKSFKPAPAVYSYFLEQVGAEAADTWLVSSNAFDLIGARAVGWKAIRVKRDPNAPFDPWGGEPTAVVRQLDELANTVAGRS